ncbi:uncharacterized protein LOC129579013 isoform X1 [Sitodiplosis mosellana]|uniref:uncharacterized protein LOC129579013 isoform X1 n=1 Tax=Sitodiplosis mosellana TaxID=263140 RepID=UPI0024452F7D|nr:uncharacterized protein LOC129579013 isoform X1 [Sitodiplosis mosellana]
MSTRKRSRRLVESDLANTQQIQSKKVPRKNQTTHTDTDTVDADEHKIDSNGETMNAEENGLATGSTERANDDSTEFNQNSNPGDDSSEDTETDNILREADVLMAEIAEFRRDYYANESQNDSQATIIISETPDAVHPTNASTNDANNATTSGQNSGARASANNSHTNNPSDDSVVLIEDMNSSAVRPIVKDDDEDVIFVTESRGSQQFRTIATIDLCDTPDTSFTRSKDTGQSTSTVAAASTAPSNSANELSPKRPGTIKCPICLETFGFDKVLSTMCGHLYCEPCIKNVIKIRKKCPMCNRGLKPNQVHRIFLDT